MLQAAPATATAPLDILQQVFGYGAFRGQQAAVVNHVCQGGDALVLMPTGGGKSLCYQVPAIARHRAGRGVTLVVSPLIALMHDQVGALDEAGVPAAFLNSSLEGDQARQVERDLMAGRLVLLYAAPERILTPRFLAMLDSLHERGLFSLVALTRRIASASGDMISARSIWACRSCTSATPTCRGWHSPPPPTTIPGPTSSTAWH